MKKALILAALGLMAGAPSAWAEQGILTCQIDVSEFAADVVRAKTRLSDSQMNAARQLVDVSRSQCRSSTDIVDANLQSMRQALRLDSGAQTAENFDEFWPADRDELQALRK